MPYKTDDLSTLISCLSQSPSLFTAYIIGQHEMKVTCANSQLSYDEYTDRAQSVGRWDSEGENWPPPSYAEAKKMKSLTLHPQWLPYGSLRDYYWSWWAPRRQPSQVYGITDNAALGDFIQGCCSWNQIGKVIQRPNLPHARTTIFHWWSDLQVASLLYWVVASVMSNLDSRSTRMVLSRHSEIIWCTVKTQVERF